MRRRSKARARVLHPRSHVLLRRAGALLTAIFLLFFLVFAIALALAPRAPATPDAVSSIAEMESFFEDLVAASHPPGLSVAVVKADDIVYERSFGLADGPAGVPASSDTVYRWWSLTKLFTALAVLQLQEQGAIGLEDDVREHLPFIDPTFRGDPVPPVRVEQLLNHSAGFRNLRFEVLRWTHPADATGPSADERLMESFERYQRLRAPPGRRGYYSNYGYFLLGALIEKASGQSYENYVRERILDPLAMRQTDFEVTESMRGHIATGCHPLIDFQTIFLPATGNLDAYVREFSKGRFWLDPFHLDANAYGGAMGTVADAANFLRAFLQQGRLNGRPVLSPETVRKMLEDGWIRAGSSGVAPYSLRRAGMQHGLGWWVFPAEGGDMYEHTGAGPGFATIMRLYPEDSLGIVVLANGTSLDRDGIADRLYELFRTQ